MGPRAAGPRRPLITDGGLATTLQDRGHDLSGALWSARVLARDAEAVLATHTAFARAGADVITTASYQATVDGLVRSGVAPSRARPVIAGSVTLARAAGEAVGRPVTVAASSGTWSALRGDGAEYRPMPAAVSVDQLATFHLERCRILADAGPDVLLFETLPGVREVRAAIQVAADLQQQSWITVTTPDGRHTVDGEDLQEVATAVDGSAWVTAVGCNCSAPEVVEDALRRLQGATSLPLVVRPNAGARWRDGAWRDDGPRAAAGEAPRRWLDAGATIVGGCCGTAPEDIAALARTLRG